MKAKRTVTVDLLKQTATLKDADTEEWIIMKKYRIQYFVPLFLLKL